MTERIDTKIIASIGSTRFVSLGAARAMGLGRLRLLYY